MPLNGIIFSPIEEMIIERLMPARTAARGIIQKSRLVALTPAHLDQTGQLAVERDI